MSLGATLMSNRQKQICVLLIAGFFTNEISKQLKIKVNTVSTIKKTIFDQTKTKNVNELYETMIIRNTQ